MTDYKQLCAQLVEQLDDALDFTVSSETRRYMKLLTRQARAALAQPEPEGPADEELLHVAARAIEPYESCGIAIGEYEPETECAIHVYGSELIAFARAVLARWGRPAPQPVPEKSKDRVCINNPVQIAECGGPCLESGPDACDCGALWRDQPAPPPKEEVAKIVDSLRRHARAAAGTRWAPLFIRAANLLERLSPHPH